MEQIGQYVGKTISAIIFADDVLNILFEGGTGIRFLDLGAQCCEVRYMTTSDDLQSFVGDKFLGYTVVNGPSVDTEDGVHESAFLNISTNAGSFTMESHNEHNGYYSGILLEVLPVRVN